MKHRYILVKSSIPLSNIDEREFYNSLNCYLGAEEYFLANPRILKVLDPQTFVLKVGLHGYEKVIAALGLIKSMKGIECAFYTVYASGTIKALEKKYHF
ncbi:MAG: Rpp14/Pop5 family protein [Candidatus Micrarchaeia archaeon]